MSRTVNKNMNNLAVRLTRSGANSLLVLSGIDFFCPSLFTHIIAGFNRLLSIGLSLLFSTTLHRHLFQNFKMHSMILLSIFMSAVPLVFSRLIRDFEIEKTNKAFSCSEVNRVVWCFESYFSDPDLTFVFLGVRNASYNHDFLGLRVRFQPPPQTGYVATWRRLPCDEPDQEYVKAYDICSPGVQVFLFRSRLMKVRLDTRGDNSNLDLVSHSIVTCLAEKQIDWLAYAVKPLSPDIPPCKIRSREEMKLFFVFREK